MPIRARIILGPRFELFLALAEVLRPAGEAEVPLWLGQARRKFDQAIRRRLGDLASVPEIWPAFAAVPEAAALDGETEAVIAALADLPPALFARRCRRAFEAIPAAARLLPRLERDPAGLQQAAVEALRRFDRLVFAALWRRARPDLAEVAQSGAPEIDADEAAEVIVLPSLFPERRFRFGRDLVLTLPAARFSPVRPVAAREDPEPVFRALGDATRYAIARLIAREALTGAELARRLGVSGATLTHHLRQLRQARLVIEERRGNRILLRLDRRTIETLSATALAGLFDAAPIAIRRSRRS
jgi:DNA-binding transcriptional ArsR family regulator